MIYPTTSNGSDFSGMNIGLFGGSFNPAHKGHLELSQYAMNELGLDQVWWMVSPQNPMKSSSDMAPLTKRIKDASAIANSDPRIVVTDIESQLCTAYTMDTLYGLKRIFNKTNFVWLMGADNLEQFHKWRDWDQIINTVAIAVFRRPGYEADNPGNPVVMRFSASRHPLEQARNLAHMNPPAWLIMENPVYQISATEIRNQRNIEKS